MTIFPYSRFFCVFVLFVFCTGSSLTNSTVASSQSHTLSSDVDLKSTGSIFVGLPTVGLKIQKDDYMCAVHVLENSSNSSDESATVSTSYITSLEYFFDKSFVHHSLLYGCSGTSEYFLSKKVRNCHKRGQGPICQGRKQIPLGIPDSTTKSNRLKFPADTAYGIGSEFGIRYLLLEVHFIQTPRDSLPPYGIQIHTSRVRPKYLAGILVMAGAGFQIPPGREMVQGWVSGLWSICRLISLVTFNVHHRFTGNPAFSYSAEFSIDINCQPEISSTIHPYAYWVHTHRLGRVVSGYKIDKKSRTATEIARWSVSWPQPVILTSSISITNGTRSPYSINPGDFVAAKCTYNSSSKNSLVHWGSRKDMDEMCDLFLFFYSESPKLRDLSLTCVNERSRFISQLLPKTADSLVDLQNPLNQKLHNINSFKMSTSSRLSNQGVLVKTNNINHTSLLCYMYSQLGIEECPF